MAKLPMTASGSWLGAAGQWAMEKERTYRFVATGWISSTSIQFVGYTPV